jgi:hypothetical protein
VPGASPSQIRNEIKARYRRHMEKGNPEKRKLEYKLRAVELGDEGHEDKPNLRTSRKHIKLFEKRFYSLVSS